MTKKVTKKSASAKAGTTKTTMLKETKNPTTKRPPNNPDMPDQTIYELNRDLNDIRGTLDNYSRHLRALDRKRLNGVGIKKLGFIERTYEHALENEEYLPHYLTIQRFGNDIRYFIDFRALLDLTRQIEEKLWNIVIESADVAYTDALEYYAYVRESAKRRVDAAEAIYNDLSVFFKHKRTFHEEVTEKQLKRDFNALLHSKKDGIIQIENVKPKLVGGKHKVVDETFNNTAKYKSVVDGEIVE